MMIEIKGLLVTQGNDIKELKTVVKRNQEAEDLPMMEHPVPANEPEEIAQVMLNPHIVALLKSPLNEPPIKRINTILKAALSRDLVMRYSMTGLGAGRQRNKLVFKDTVCCRLIESECGSFDKVVLFPR